MKKSRIDTLGMLAPPSATTSRAASPAVSLAAITDDGFSASGEGEESEEKKKEEAEPEEPESKSTKSSRKLKAKA